MKGNFIYQRLGERLSRIRKQKAISQDKLASFSDVDRTYIAKIENGKANPSFKVLVKIARGLKIKVATLLEGV
jgi:Predicted transcriptional regulators